MCHMSGQSAACVFKSVTNSRLKSAENPWCRMSNQSVASAYTKFFCTKIVCVYYTSSSCLYVVCDVYTIIKSSRFLFITFLFGEINFIIGRILLWSSSRSFVKVRNQGTKIINLNYNTDLHIFLWLENECLSMQHTSNWQHTQLCVVLALTFHCNYFSILETITTVSSLWNGLHQSCSTHQSGSKVAGFLLTATVFLLSLNDCVPSIIKT